MSSSYAHREPEKMNSTCPGCRERFYAYPESDDCEMMCGKCGAEFTYAEGRRGRFFVKEQKAERDRLADKARIDELTNELASDRRAASEVFQWLIGSIDALQAMTNILSDRLNKLDATRVTPAESRKSEPVCKTCKHPESDHIGEYGAVPCQLAHCDCRLFSPTAPVGTAVHPYNRASIVGHTL